MRGQFTWEEINGEVEVTATSMLSGDSHTMTLDVSGRTFQVCLNEWTKGATVQRAFPMLGPNEREFLMTGMTPLEWEAAFGGDEEPETAVPWDQLN